MKIKFSEFPEAGATGAFVNRQLRECDRVFDLKGQPLSLAKLGDIAYEIMRYRQADGGKASPVDILTTDDVRSEVGPVVLDYFKKKYGLGPGDYRELLKSSAVGSYLEFSLPHVRLAFFAIGKGDSPVMWILDFSDMTEEFALMNPKRHAFITGFKGIVE